MDGLIGMDTEFIVPGSTANLGSGFDTLGVALSVFLKVTVKVEGELSSAILRDTRAKLPPEEQVTVEFENVEPEFSLHYTEQVPTSWRRNLITQAAAFVLFTNKRTFPKTLGKAGISIRVKNGIPLQRGLGSSSAAVVAGVRVGNYLGGLQLSETEMLAYATCIEGEPDNASASLLGGCIATMCDEHRVKLWNERWIKFTHELKRCNSYEELFESSLLFSDGAFRDQDFASLCHFARVRWNPGLFAVAIIPDYGLSTASSRSVLPDSYTRGTVINSLQRLAVSLSLLGGSDSMLKSREYRAALHLALKDELHQPYRQSLVAGLAKILSLKVDFISGFIGATLSGAGPTVVAFATENFHEIGRHLCGLVEGEQGLADTKSISAVYRKLSVFTFS